LRNARTRYEILAETGLDEKAVDTALHELRKTGEIKEKDGGYWICRDELYEDYAVFFRNQQSSQELAKPTGKLEVPDRKSELVNWIDQWKAVKKLDFSLEHEHFFLVGRHLNDLSEELISNAKNEVLIVNPFIQNCSLSRTLEDTHNNGAKVTVVTRPPDEKDPERARYLKEEQEYHSKLKEAGINLIYNNQVHAKLIVVDNSIAIVSSMNFYSGSTGGRTWEAGLITTENKTVKSIVDSINKLQEKLGRKNKRL
jgi:phosphatidylserine/phosphatidylglycerophosphate/cardiolipin synthase-like enzyme